MRKKPLRSLGVFVTRGVSRSFPVGPKNCAIQLAQTTTGELPIRALALSPPLSFPSASGDGTTPPSIVAGKDRKSDPPTPEPPRGDLRENVTREYLQPPASAAAVPPIDQWHQAFADLAAEIKLRHYSPKTIKSYSVWVRKVSASSQNFAFNALLFFRHVFKQDFGDHADNVRAKKTNWFPFMPYALIC